MKSYINLFRNYANFSGFLKRKPFWTAVLIHLVILIMPLVPGIMYYLGKSALLPDILDLSDSRSLLSKIYIPWVLPLWCFYFLLTRIPILSACVRRLHTLPKKGWWMLLGLIPVVGWFILFIWFLQKGNYESFEKRIGSVLPGLLKAAEKPKNGGWFFVVFILLAVSGFFLNKQIMKTGSVSAAIRDIPAVFHDLSDALKTGRNRNADKKENGAVSAPDQQIAPDAAEGETLPAPVYLSPIPGQPITSLKFSAALYPVSDEVFAQEKAVSVNDYAACVRDGVCSMPSQVETLAYGDLSVRSWMTEDVSENETYSVPFPMVFVTRDMAAGFCEWAGMRLPTAEEWKEAARSSSIEEYSAENANCVGTDRSTYIGTKEHMIYTVPTDAFSDHASDHGMIQMVGNVWEWTSSSGSDEGTVLALGGAWNSYPDQIGPDAELETLPGYAANNIGFRCFADASNLTDAFFEGGEPISEVEAEEIDPDSAADAEETDTGSNTNESVKIDIISGSLISDIGSKAAKSPEPEETLLPTRTPSPTSTPSPTATPDKSIHVTEGVPVIAKKDDSMLYLTSDDVLASIYAVTVKQYIKCVEDGACEMPEALNRFAYRGMLDDENTKSTAEKLPMIYVTGEQAASYCDWAGMRLPTVTEWKEAGRMPEDRILTEKDMNCVGTNRKTMIRTDAQQALTVPVTAFRRKNSSVYGMVQMTGNVWEWTAAEGSSGTMIALGGAWNSYPANTGTEAELETASDYAADNIGFRCFADADMLTTDLFELSDASISVLSNPELWKAEGIRAKDDAEMIYIPAATFKMGVSNGAVDEKPVHDVTLSSYWIDAYEVTNAQYALCVAAGVCTEPHEVKSFRRQSYYGNSEFDGHPVIYVDRNQAETYCEWAETRLPTEAEWEYAAKGPNEYIYPWGNTFTASKLNFSGNGNYDTLAVDATPEDMSDFGVYNLGGNVAEWVLDRYQENWYTVTDQPLDPTGPSVGKYYVIRGSSTQMAENNARTSDRFYAQNTSFSQDRGFRCAVSEETE